MLRILFIFLLALQASNGLANDVLVKVGTGEVTSFQLEQALNAAPFATQFPGMDEKDQARLRGDMLLRLAQAEALYQEAIEQGFDQQPVFVQEMANFRTTLLAQRYLNGLRNEFIIPETIDKTLHQKYQGNGDALSASRSAYVAKYFSDFKARRIEQLKQRYKVHIHTDKLKQTLAPETILMTGDQFSIKGSDLMLDNPLAQIDKSELESKLKQWSNLLVLARAAEDQKIDIQGQMLDYQHPLLTRMLLEKKQQEWMPDELTLQRYYQSHPNTGYIPERRQIGQIVVATASLAEQLRGKIKSGESLFELASKYSIDVYGREQAGDMGWLQEHTGMPEIEAALKALPDGEVSPVIKTVKGYHLVMIVSRKPAERKEFVAIKDRVRQALIAEKMPDYLKWVMARHPLEWKIPDHL